jgi:hypothetical protein
VPSGERWMHEVKFDGYRVQMHTYCERCRGAKKTCAQRETPPTAAFAFDGNKWDGLYLGRMKGKDLIYAGKVDHDFERASAKNPNRGSSR